MPDKAEGFDHIGERRMFIRKLTARVVLSGFASLSMLCLATAIALYGNLEINGLPVIIFILLAPVAGIICFYLLAD